MFNESLQNGLLPLTLRQATISLKMKKDEDPLSCSSYRPISLLCADVKILAKMLARRLEFVLPTIISADQTGFIKNRHSLYNVRRLFDILYSPSTSDDPELVISMDAEKAFDRVEWPYLHLTVLKEFGHISGYKLNLHKSELMPVNAAAIAHPLSKLPFRTSLEHFKYLGVCVTKTYSELFKCNFSPLLTRLSQDIHRWSLLPLSLTGRINCIKMNVLPMFYLFQCISIFLPKHFFHSLDSLISQFIWNKSTPTIKK